MRKYLLALLVLACIVALPVFARFGTPVADNLAVIVDLRAPQSIKLSAVDPDNTTLVYTIVSSPTKGTISNFSGSTGSLVYTPSGAQTAGTTDTFTYRATNAGNTNSNTATVTVTFLSKKTRVRDQLPGKSGGKITFVLTQKTTSVDGLLPVGSTVSANVDANGWFQADLYPTPNLAPTCYYQVWYAPTTAGNQSLVGVYSIPSTSAIITLSPYEVTNTNLAAQYVFPSNTAINSILSQLAAISSGGVTLSQSLTTTAVPFNILVTNLGGVAPNATFTKNTTGQQAGFGAIARVTGDGTNTPTFSGFLKANSSANYITSSGTLNVIQFWFDGTSHWYSIFQEAGIGGSGDGVAPILASAVVSVLSPSQIVLTYNEALDEASVPATGQFTPSGSKTVTNVAVTGVTVTLTLNSAYSSGDTVTLSYTVPGSNALRDTSSNNAAALSSQSVTNGAGTLSDASYSPLSGFSLSGTTYTSTASPAIGLATYSPAANTDFAYQTKWSASDAGGGLLGLSNTNSNIQYASMLYFAWTASNALYRSPGAVNTGVTLSAGDYFRIARIAGSIKLQTSPDGSTWTTVYTYGTDTTQMYLHMQQVSGTGVKVYEPKILH